MVLSRIVLKMTVLWDVAPWSRWDWPKISEVRTAFIIRAAHRPDDGGSTSETSVSCYYTTRCNIPENNYLYSCCSQTLNITSVRIARLRAEIWTMLLPNTK